MILKSTVFAGAVLALAAPALAQNATQTTTTTVVERSAVPQITTEKEAQALIGAPLDTSASGAGAVPASSSETLFIIESNNIKPLGEWTEADRQACKNAGGIELEMPAGRVACF